MSGPRDLIGRMPEREGFERRVVSEAEFDHYESNDWVRVKRAENDRFKDSFTDPVAGKQFLMEMPKEKFKEFFDEHMGGKITRLQREALVGSRRNRDGGKQEVTIEERELPPQARVRRKEG